LGDRAVVAVRPEDFRTGEDGDNHMRVVIDVVEYHGRDHAVQGRLPGGQVIRLRTGSRVRPGDTVPVCVSREHVLVFATDTAAATAAGTTTDTAADTTAAAPTAAGAGP
jgi:putative spermidine/putrescine transport system ATP-binding protein